MEPGEEKNSRVPLFQKINHGLDLQVSYLIVAVFFFLVSLKVHLLTLNFAFIFAAYVFVLFLFSFVTKNKLKRVFTTKYFTGTVLCIGGCIAISLFAPHVIESFWRAARFEADFSSLGLKDTGYYRFFLSDNYPFFFFILPLSAVMMMAEKGRRGFLILISFAVIFILHSYLYSRKDPRYIFYIFPFFVIIGSYFTSRLITLGCGYFEKSMQRNIKPVFYPICFLALLVGFNVVGYPWLSNAKAVIAKPPGTDFKNVPAELYEAMRKATVFTTRHTHYMYYADDLPKYFVREENRDFNYVYDDNYDISVIDSAGALDKKVEQTTGEVYFYTDAWSFRKESYLSDAMKKVILKRFEKIKHKGNEEVFIFRKK
jgi:hypothetical protein